MYPIESNDLSTRASAEIRMRTAELGGHSERSKIWGQLGEVFGSPRVNVNAEA